MTGLVFITFSYLHCSFPINIGTLDLASKMKISLVLGLISSTLGFQVPLNTLIPQRRIGGKMSLSLSTSELDKIQASAHEASENWVHSLTSFLNEEDAAKVESRLKELGDVQYIKIGRIFPEGSRSRFVMSNPDLPLGQKETESEFCSLLHIENIQQGALPKTASGSNAWPALFTRIGIQVEDVGDVLVDSSNDSVYIVIAPEAVKQCKRILPKELKGLGITITEIDLEDINSLSLDGVIQEMELGRLDKRAMKY